MSNPRGEVHNRSSCLRFVLKVLALDGYALPSMALPMSVQRHGWELKLGVIVPTKPFDTSPWHSIIFRSAVPPLTAHSIRMHKCAVSQKEEMDLRLDTVRIN